jgi:biopolymer transport protein ExbD
MAFSTAGNRGPLSEINVTPLVDVMLVLLIIFIVTLPLVTRPITMNLPQRVDTPQRPLEPPPPIQLRLDASGQLFWNASPLPLVELQPRLREAMAQAAGNTPELRIEANPDTEYEVTAKVLAAAENAQVDRIGFVQ